MAAAQHFVVVVVVVLWCDYIALCMMTLVRGACSMTLHAAGGS